MHVLLPADRGRVADGVRGDLRRPAPVHRLVLYDVDKVLDAASVEDDKDLYEAQRQLILDPNDPDVIAGARPKGFPTSGSPQHNGRRSTH